MSDEPNVGIRFREQKRLKSSTVGRQRRCRRNPRWQAVPHPRTSNRKCSAANSGAVNRRLNEAVVAGRAKSSATWKVDNGKQGVYYTYRRRENFVRRAQPSRTQMLTAAYEVLGGTPTSSADTRTPITMSDPASKVRATMTSPEVEFTDTRSFPIPVSPSSTSRYTSRPLSP